MANTFSNRENSQRIREPLFNMSRVKYRAPRSSELENLETNLLKLDFTRILNELDNIDIKILNSVTYLLGDTKVLSTSQKLDDGLSYDINGVEVYIDGIIELDYTLNIDTIDKLSSKLSRLSQKIKRLESGN